MDLGRGRLVSDYDSRAARLAVLELGKLGRVGNTHALTSRARNSADLPNTALSSREHSRPHSRGQSQEKHPDSKHSTHRSK